MINTVPAFVVMLALSSKVLDKPKSITLIGESSCLAKNKKFSGFKSL